MAAFVSYEEFYFYPASADDAIANIDSYAEAFAQHGIVVLKDAYLSEYDAVRVLTRMGKQLGWTPNHPGSPFETLSETPSSEEPATWKHIVRHAERVDQAKQLMMNSANDQIIQWHLDGVAAEFQHMAAGWNMQVFTCDPSAGSSGFLDMQSMVEAIPLKFIDLLRSAEIAHLPIMRSPRVATIDVKLEFARLIKDMQKPTWILDVDDYISSYPRPAITQHPHTGVNTLRTDPVRAPWGFQEFLFSVDGRLPTQAEYSLFDEYFAWFDATIHGLNDERTYWHQWGPGDLVVPDLFRMLHGVRGGFEDGQRIFNAYWCFPPGTPVDNELRMSIEDHDNL